MAHLPADPLYSSFFERTISHASSLGADTGECFRAIHDNPTTPSAWMEAWSKQAKRLDEHAASSTNPESAKLAYLRSCNYWRTAYAPLIGAPLDSSVMPCYMAMREAFSKAAKLFDPPLEPLTIPYAGVQMRGYLCKPVKPTTRLMIVIGGYDSPMEELYFFTAHHAIARGYACVIFDGPGQGGTLLEGGLTLSHTYDKVLEAVLDVVAKLGSWQSIVVHGLSLGGLLCLQACSGTAQQRVHAVVADPGEVSLLEMFRNKLPLPASLKDQVPEGNAVVNVMVNFMLSRAITQNDGLGWVLRRGMLVHGTTTPMDYVKTLHEFDNTGILDKITIPTLVTRAENDDIAVDAERVFEKLVNCPKKELVRMENEAGAGDHCSTGARIYYMDRVCSWLDQVLQSA